MTNTTEKTIGLKGQVIHATLQEGILTLPDGQSIDLAKVQAQLNSSFMKSGELGLQDGCDALSKVTGVCANPYGQLVPTELLLDASPTQVEKDLAAMDGPIQAASVPGTAVPRTTYGALKFPAKLDWSTISDHPEIGLCINDYFVVNPLYDVGLIDKVDPLECWGLTQEQAQFIVDLNDGLVEAVEDALNAACARLQEVAGIKDGGFAGIYFSDQSIRNKLMEVLASYIVDEVNSYDERDHL